MQQAELNDFLAYLDQLLELTTSGKMVWSQNNPSTYIWHAKPGTNARLIIQQIAQGIFSFQAMDEENKPRMQANGMQYNAANAKLSAIFKTIEKLQDRKGLDFLKSILPS